MKAFEVNGLDYLMKPVERERLAHAVRRILGPPVKHVDHWRMHEEDYVYVTSTFTARFIQVKKIRYIIAAGPYSDIVTADAGNWLMPRSIADWERRHSIREICPHPSFRDRESRFRGSHRTQ